LEHNSETERSFSRRHGEVAEEEKATDKQHCQEATQHDFEWVVMYEYPGDGDGTVTFRRPVANGPGQRTRVKSTCHILTGRGIWSS
jgi:hypothetical protein